jgi:hypothetical protein
MNENSILQRTDIFCVKEYKMIFILIHEKDGEIMGKIVKKYRFSKFKRFADGLMFALISSVAIWLCINGMSDYPDARSEIILPFIVAVISMILGFVTMIRHPEPAKGKA